MANHNFMPRYLCIESLGVLELDVCNVSVHSRGVGLR